MKNTLFLLFLAGSLLFFSCKGRNGNNRALEADNPISNKVQDENRQTSTSENTPAEADDSTEINVTPEALYPVETWLTDHNMENPVEPIHPIIGRLMPVDPAKDELELYEKSLGILNTLPDQNPQTYYPAIRQALRIKIGHLKLQGESLLGIPQIEGATAEVLFLLIQEEEMGREEHKGIFYWIFEDNNWYLEDLTVY